MLLLISQVCSSHSFHARTTSIKTVAKRVDLLKSTRESSSKAYNIRPQRSDSTPGVIKFQNPNVFKLNPFKWFSSTVSAATTPDKTNSPNAFIKSSSKRLGERYKVISDVDDTIVSSGGVKLFGIKLGGVDNRFKRGQFYPGVVQFALELSRVGHASTHSQSASSFSHSFWNLPSKVAVLTARAREFKFALALKPSGKLNKRYRSHGENFGLSDWGIGDVYYGSVVEWIFHHRKGLRKFKNFEIMLRNDDKRHDAVIQSSQFAAVATPASLLPPRPKYILLGDTGEKDEEAGEHMASNYPDRVRAIFLHTVYTLPRVLMGHARMKPLPIPNDRFVNSVPVYYFRTYVGAAVKAYNNHLLGKDAVMRVAKTAIEEMKDLDALAQKDFHIKMKFFSRFPIPAQKKDLWRKQFEEIRRLRWEEIHQDLKTCSFLKPYLSLIPVVTDSSTPSNSFPFATRKSSQPPLRVFANARKRTE